MRRSVIWPEQNLRGEGRLFPDVKRRLFRFDFLLALKRTMKAQNYVETCLPQEQGKHFDTAVGYYELQMLDEAEAELSKINPCVAAQSVPVLALLLAIS